MFTTKKIIFKSLMGKESEKYLTLPRPSKKVMPDWFKKIPNFQDKGDYGSITVKKCIPFLDALSMGYILSSSWEMGWTRVTPVDGDGKKAKAGFKITYPAPVRDVLQDHAFGLEQHPPFQFSDDGYNEDETKVTIKILSPWLIKTPPGYSCLFVSPLNHSNIPFRPLTGVVDTDKYSELPINFPSIPKKFPEKQKIKIIPVGTPIVMVIPFKRESWKMDVQYSKSTARDGSVEEANKRLSFFKRIIDNYKNVIWNRKNFD